MSGNSYAVLVGINDYDDPWLSPLRYAEKDCRDLHQVLTDPEIGTCEPQRCKLLLGREATTRKIEEVLYQQVVKDRDPDDLILVYFSGHGFLASDHRRAYLGTRDVAIKELLSNPNAGLRIEYIHSEIFSVSRARQVLLLLDCCHSGAIVPNPMRSKDGGEAGALVDERFYARSNGRVAVFSCPADAVSRESEDLENGIFTHYILKGLRGSAAEPDSGEVTLDSLLAYIRQRTPAEQPPGRYGHDTGRIVLTRPRRQEELPQTTTIHLNLVQKQFEALTLTPLRHPLEPFERFIPALMARIQGVNEGAGEAPERHLLEAVRAASGADFVFTLRGDQDQWVTASQSDFGPTDIIRDQYLGHVLARIGSTLVDDEVVSTEHHGMRHLFDEGESIRGALAIVPLHRQPTAGFMVVCGLAEDSPLLADPYASILSSLYRGSRELTTIQPPLVEGAILDGLKRLYGFVPLGMYNRRFEIFCERLSKMLIHFEPILLVDPEHLHIGGWEALARDPANLRAPSDLFLAAELWGSRFMIELDQHFIRLAAHSYRDACRGDPSLSRPENQLPLSVNVYPESLIRTAYFEAARELFEERVVPPGKLVLEISEKMPIPDTEDGGGGARGLAAFRRRLQEYVRQFHIGFSIDDFGVGYASVSRLARLNPTYVKIDRDVLLQEAEEAKTIIRFVVELVTQRMLAPPQIVIEGFDDSSSLTLRELHQLGISLVQGYIIGRAGPELNQLEPEVRTYLSQLITGEAPASG